LASQELPVSIESRSLLLRRYTKLLNNRPIWRGIFMFYAMNDEL
jgi:hypothetical protein